LNARSLPPADITARGAAVGAIAGRMKRCRVRRGTLTDLVVARALVANGHQQMVRGALTAVPDSSPEARACRRLLIESCSSAHDSRLSRTDPPGVVSLASWRNQMQLVDGLPELLSLLEEADDELSVLVGGCEWLCRRAGAARSAIVSADGAVLLASAGWRSTDLAGEIAEVLRGPDRDIRSTDDGLAAAFGVSVRSLGATAAYVVVRCRPTDRPALQSSALTFATFCGPAVRARLDVLAAAERGRHHAPELIGSSPLMVSVRAAVVRAAAAPFPVLIEGESGTGKELVARALHRMSARRDRRLNAVNCAALTDELVEAELFGHVRGAFTGAIGPRAGLFEESHGGTLFLDEVTELSPRAQAKLLRVLQEREIRRVGENQARAVDVRILAACNVTMADAVATGRFRDDLRFRLAVIRIALPPLRERVEDIPTLALAFWRRFAAEAGTRALLGPDALARLTRHGWSGNVRELQNAMAGLVVAAPLRGRVSARHVEQVLAQAAPVVEMPGVRLEAARRTFERRVVLGALTRHGGRRHAAAAELGLTRQGLTKAMRRLGLATDEHAAGVA
jgi:DNA-binding NtrC family response regulator